MIAVFKIILFFTVLNFPTVLFAQEEEGFLDFKGTTSFNNIPVEGVRVTVYRNNKKFGEATSSKKGKFSIELQYFCKYTILISKKDIETIKIFVNTHISRKDLPVWTTYHTKIPCIQEKEDSLFKEITKRGGLILVKYSPEKHKFIDTFDFDAKEFEKEEKEKNRPVESPARKDKTESVSPPVKTTTDIHVAEQLSQKQALLNKQEVQKAQNKMIEQAHKQDKLNKQKYIATNTPHQQEQISHQQQAASNIQKKKEATKNRDTREKQNNKILEESIKNTALKSKNKAITATKPHLSQREKKGYLFSSLITELSWPDKKITLVKETTLFGVERFYIDDKPVKKEEFEGTYSKIIDLGLWED